MKVAEFQKQCEEYLVVIVQQKQVECTSHTHAHTYTVETLYKRHHWDPADCPV